MRTCGESGVIVTAKGREDSPPQAQSVAADMRLIEIQCMRYGRKRLVACGGLPDEQVLSAGTLLLRPPSPRHVLSESSVTSGQDGRRRATGGFRQCTVSHPRVKYRARAEIRCSARKPEVRSTTTFEKFLGTHVFSGSMCRRSQNCRAAGDRQHCFGRGLQIGV